MSDANRLSLSYSLVSCLLAQEGFLLTPERLRSALSDRTRMLIFCNPSNPTGAVHSKVCVRSRRAGGCELLSSRPNSAEPGQLSFNLLPQSCFFTAPLLAREAMREGPAGLDLLSRVLLGFLLSFFLFVFSVDFSSLFLLFSSLLSYLLLFACWLDFRSICFLLHSVGSRLLPSLYCTRNKRMSI